MHSAMDFLLRQGYVVIFLAVFIEQIGLPIPSGPVLAAGALAGFRRLNLAPALALAVAASLISDSLWFNLGRRRGGSVLKFVCRVCIEPDTYCSCPDELTSVRAGLRLKRHGLTRVHALLGGFSGWRALGFPVDVPRASAARA